MTTPPTYTFGAVTLTADECRALHALIDILSGGNAQDAFTWDGTEDPADAQARACAKVYKAAGFKVPKELKGV